jgi:hypothetical protein
MFDNYFFYSALYKMSYNIIHDDESGDKPSEWNNIKVNRLTCEELVLENSGLDFSYGVGPTLSAYYNSVPGNVLIPNVPITTYYQRVGKVVTIGITGFNCPLPAPAFNIILAGLQFTADRYVSGVYPCVSDVGYKNYNGSFIINSSDFTIQPPDGGPFLTNFEFFPIIIQLFVI